MMAQNFVLSHDTKQIIINTARFIFVFLVTWLVFYLIHSAFPFIANGGDLVYKLKQENIRYNLEFPDVDYRVIIFGNSKVLSGFVPDEFDAVAPNRIYSFNGGLPDSWAFVRELELLIARGEIPSHVILTIPWSTSELENPNIFDDEANIQHLFPFRNMLRDFALFALRSREFGSMTAFYNHNQLAVETMMRDRGYYFIEGQSHYPNDEVPNDYTQSGDQVAVARDPRIVETESPIFSQLHTWSVIYEIDFIFVPVYYRVNEYAAAPQTNLELVEVLNGYDNFFVVGPDYLSLPLNHFSDPVHLNRYGACMYTIYLRNLLSEHLDFAEGATTSEALSDLCKT